jgi:hypothetical protein
MVVTYHVCSSFVGYLNSPAMEEQGPAQAFQYPFLRLVVGGRTAISLFFIITGYVNSLSTIKHVGNGDNELALTNLSKSTFTRIGRLVLPTDVAVAAAWLVSQLNLHRLAGRVDAYWISAGAHEPVTGFLDAVGRLVRNITLFWHFGVSEYDGTFWTIPFFVKGSMLVYIVLLATAMMSPRYKKLALIFLYLYAWSGGQGLLGIPELCFFFFYVKTFRL